MLPIYKNKILLTDYISSVRQAEKTVGFVPTMGALHDGHISLIEKSSEESDITVCSIFVNPTQFNETSDFEKYPRMIEKDIQILGNTNCSVIFAPDSKEIYTDESIDLIDIKLGYLEHELEGKFRPGHFKGVVSVVKRLFDIVQPDKAFFGQKDYQQFMIIKKMVEYFNLKTELICCPVIREKDGLAMSSRNLRLTPKERDFAPTIYQSLIGAKELLGKSTIKEIKSWAESLLSKNDLVDLEYFEIRNAEDLKPVKDVNEVNELAILAALKVGKVRLIDNILVKPH